MSRTPLAYSFARLLYRLAPKYNGAIYEFSHSYVDHFCSQNNDDTHTNGELFAMRRYLPGSSVIFDVGANVGNWAAKALELSPQATIHCFEPSSYTYQQLVARQFPGNVICNNMGLGAKAEKLPLYVFEDGSGMNSLYQRRGLQEGWNIQPQQKYETVMLDTLDDYAHSRTVTHIDYLKLDVEGHELAVLQGARRMIAGGHISTIQFEYGGCNIDARTLLQDIFAFFESYPYTFYKLYPAHFQSHAQYDQRLENFQYQNWIIVHEP